LLNKIANISRVKKQLLFILTDSISVVLGLLFTSFLTLGDWYFPKGDLFWITVCSPIIALPIFWKFDLYRSIVRFIGIQALWSIIKATFLYALAWSFFGYFLSIEYISISVALINWFLVILLIGGMRITTRWLLLKPNDLLRQQKVIIYGAGSSGRQLANALLQSDKYKPIAFIDDDIDLINQYINDIQVYNISDVALLIQKHNVKKIFLSVSRSKRNDIINLLEAYPVHVQILPSISELAQGNIKIGDLREVDINDLLGREVVESNKTLLQKNIKNKVVMVTGAGGSIGSELCRQIVKLGASKLILFEQSELNLYKINQELFNNNVFPVLGSITNQRRVESVCEFFCVNTIYHAAAYKHVPMIELNNIEGVNNNIFGTLKCAKAAINKKVESFVLISTDKAVRPTSIMGATKRGAEMILQALSDNQNTTKFTMVRFGNVLDSSGSVVPLFRKQIKSGGPITVTNKDVVRFFMTIPEAVELVIQAGSLGKGGEIFVLDMGEPVNILNLAKKMVHLSGLKVRDKSSPNGDIEIQVIGLRLGEKLFEELLIDGEIIKTQHPKIMKINEKNIPRSSEELMRVLSKLEVASKDYKLDKVRSILIDIVPEFTP
jgi:FlaA1/EpsC-like NDP-sugar epimerase